MNPSVLQALLNDLQQNNAVALATIVAVQGSAPAPVGAKMLVYPDGGTVGTVGGGALEEHIVADARTALAEGHSQVRHYSLTEEGEDAVDTLCGGAVDVFIEAYSPRPTLLLIGGGHVGRPLAEMAPMVDFQVDVVDVDPERGSLAALEQATITEHTYVVIMTAEANADEEALRQVIDRPAAYIGMIGSRNKVATIFEHLRKDGVPEEALGRVHAPIGLNLGGRSPAEIALSVLAEMVMVRHNGDGRPLKTSSAP